MGEPFLETSRLRLERPLEADGPALTGLWRDGRVQGFLGGVVSRRTAGERFARVLAHWEDRGYGMCAVRERSSGRMAGLCGLTDLGDEVEVAYKLWPGFWGRGYATEAASACLDYGFGALRLERVVGVTQGANRASRRVLEKLGMRHERDAFMWNAPQRVYALERKDRREVFEGTTGR